MLLSMRPQSSSFVYSESRIMVPISMRNFCQRPLSQMHLNSNRKTQLWIAWIGGSQTRIRVLAAAVTMSAADGGFSTQNTANYGITWPIGMVGISPCTDTKFNAGFTMSKCKPLSEKDLELLVETVEYRPPHENPRTIGFSISIEKMETESSKNNNRGDLLHEGHKGHLKETRQEFHGSRIDKENLRRQRISEANRGRVPWNKGKQHSEETKKRIRETVLKKMRDPKMREKLRIQALAIRSCPEIMLKIQSRIRNAWKEKRRIRAIQETCVVEWKEVIAESARIGNDGDEVYQWDSYTTIKQQLRSAFNAKQKQEKTNLVQRRSALSEEHKLRISKAIKERWADPVYRQSVQKGVEGAVKRRTANSSSKTTGHKQLSGASRHSRRATDGTLSHKIPAPNPSVDVAAYKDSESKTKLEKLKSMRAYRLAVENMKRRDITERARVLIAQAEEAAKALEAAAKKDKNALGPLLETRRLLAEAVQSISSASRGKDVKQLQSGDEGQAI